MKYIIHYTLRADGPDGEIIEATVPEEPFAFSAGAEEVLDGLEAAQQANESTITWRESGTRRKCYAFRCRGLTRLVGLSTWMG